MLRTHHAEHRSPHRYVGSHKVHAKRRDSGEGTRPPKTDPDPGPPGRRDDHDASQSAAYRGYDAYDLASYGRANDERSTVTYTDERNDVDGAEASEVDDVWVADLEIDDVAIDAFSPS